MMSDSFAQAAPPPPNLPVIGVGFNTGRMATTGGFGSSAPSPLEGEGRGGGWFSEPLMDPHPQSLPSRGREAKAAHWLTGTAPHSIGPSPSFRGRLGGGAEAGAARGISA